jgi:AraC-like DNA-binding protein
VATPWRGRLFFMPGQLMYAGPLGPTTMHAHHALQIVVAPGAPLRLRGLRGHAVECRAAVVPADVEHAMDGTSASGLLLLLDAETFAGRCLARDAGSGLDARSWARAGEKLLHSTPERLPETWEEGQRAARSIMELLAGDEGSEPREQARHPAVRRALRLVPSMIDQVVRLGDIAGQVQLSTARLSRLFTRELGLSFRQYVLWQRMIRAAEAIQAGRTIGESAHRAGFADAAHLTRTFRRMFGSTPSDYVRGAVWVAPPGPGPIPTVHGAQWQDR